MRALFQQANESVLAVHGVDALVGAEPLRVVFADDYVSTLDMSGSRPVAGTTAARLFALAGVTEVEAMRGRGITIGAVGYVIRNPKSDGSGWVDMDLERV